MKKLKLYFMALALLICGGAKAEIVQNYVCDFETAIDVSGSTIKVAPGWSYFIETGSYTSPWTYNTVADARGVNGSACLSAGYKISSSWTTYSADYLITPKISGTMTVQLAGMSSSSAVKFYKFTTVEGVLTKGEEISATSTGDLYQSPVTFVTYTIEGLDNEMIGIWASSTRIDDFHATSADIVLEKKLTLSSTTLKTSSTPDCDAEGNYTITAEVKVKNSGEAPVSNYTVTVYNNTIESKPVLASETVTEELAVGAEKTITLSGTANINTDKTDETNECQWYAKEYVTNTTKYVGKVTPVAYLPVLRVNNSAGNKLTSGVALPYGYINAVKTTSFSVQNDGAAPMDITDVTCPEGFSVDLTAPVTLAAHESKAFTVTASVETIGSHSGNLVITAGEQSFTIALSSTVLDSEKYFEAFDGSSLPVGFVSEGSWSVGSGTAYHSSSTNTRYLITPLLDIAGETDTFSFDVAKKGSSSSLAVYAVQSRISSQDDLEDPLLEIKADEMGTSTSDMKTFSISGLAAGNYYIVFVAGYTSIDNLYGFKRVDVDNDIVLSSNVFPKTAMQNKPYEATMRIKNINDKDADVTATLYVNGDEVASQQATIASNSDNLFTFNVKLHNVGENSIIATATAGKVSVETEEGTVTVSEEVADNTVSVGNASELNSSYGVLRPYYKKSLSETIYTAQALGLSNGQKINQIIYKGTTGGGITPTIELYIENTTDAELSATGLVGDTTQMTKVFEGKYVINATPSTSSSLGYQSDLLVFELSEPFTYTGGNLRIIGHHDCTAYKACYFEVDGNDKSGSVAYLKNNDTDLSKGTWAKQTKLPVVHFGLVSEPTTIAGTITDATYNTPVANVNVELKNAENDVIYTGKTDREGKYSINVIQNSLSYDATYTNDKYATATAEALSCAEGSTVKDITLTFNGEAGTYNYAFKEQYGTIILPFAVNVPEGMKAYTCAEAEENGKLVLAESSVIAAGVPYIVEKTGETATFALAGAKVYDSTDAVTEGLLTGVFTDYTTVGGEYILQNNNDVLGFYKVNTATATPKVPANHAYITAPSETSVRAFFFDDLADDATAIETVNSLVSGDIQAIYTTNGAQVNTLQKGINIVKYANGKTAKILVK